MYRIGAFYCQIAAGIAEAGMRDVEETFNYARSHGITEIDFNSKEINDSTAAMLKNCGMHAASVHGAAPCEFETREKYLESLDFMKRAIDKAVAIGSPYFMNVPQPPKDMSPDKHGDLVKAIREQFSDLCEYAKQLPITVTVEDFSTDAVPYATFEDIDYLLENNPSLMFTYDSGNFPLAGIDEAEGAKRYADRTIYVHLKDLKVVENEGILRRGVYYDSLELGGGYLKNLESLKILKNAGFTDGVITIEVNSSFDRLSRTIKSVDWLKSAIANI